MAINFAGLLGGLGAGAQQLATQQEQQRQFDINKLFAERTFQEGVAKRKQDFELAQKTADRLDAAQRRQEQILANQEAAAAFSVVNQIASGDLQDEITTRAELGKPGLTDAQRQGILAARKEKHDAAANAIRGFGALPDFQRIYGDPLKLLKPSTVLMPGYKPTVNVTFAEEQAAFKAARDRIAAVPKANQLSQWKQQFDQLVSAGFDQSVVEKNLARPGAVIEPGVTTAKTRAAMPGETAGIFGNVVGVPSFVPSETTAGGKKIERSILPSGEVQVQETTAPILQEYVTPEMETMRVQAQRLKNDELAALLNPRIRKATVENEILELRSKLLGKQLAWYDRLTTAQINQMNSAARKAAAAGKKANSDLLSLSDRVKLFMAQSLNAYRTDTMTESRRKNSLAEVRALRSEITRLRITASQAKMQAGQASDSANEQFRQSSMQEADNLSKQADDLEAKLKAFESGNVAAMEAASGISPINVGTAGAADLSSFVQRQTPAAQLMGNLVSQGLGGVVGPGGQQAPAAPNVIVAPNISIPGMGGAAAGAVPGLGGTGFISTGNPLLDAIAGQLGPGGMGAAGGGGGGMESGPVINYQNLSKMYGFIDQKEMAATLEGPMGSLYVNANGSLTKEGTKFLSSLNEARKNAKVDEYAKTFLTDKSSKGAPYQLMERYISSPNKKNFKFPAGWSTEGRLAIIREAERRTGNVGPRGASTVGRDFKNPGVVYNSSTGQPVK